MRWLPTHPAAASRKAVGKILGIVLDNIILSHANIELELAAEWALSKNAGPEYHDIIARVVRHVQSLR